MTGNRVGKEWQERVKAMVPTNNGFVSSEKDMELRGPGDIEGTRQSGLLDLKLADIVQDRAMLAAARESAEKILEEDPDLELAENKPLHDYLATQRSKSAWSKIS